MKHYLLLLCLFLMSCQADKAKNEACHELYIETADKKFLDMKDCSSELSDFKEAQQKKIKESYQKLDEEQKREAAKGELSEQSLSDLPPLKKRLLITDFKNLLCTKLKPRLAANKTEYDTPSYTLSISKLEEVGLVFALVADWPEGAADIQSIWLKANGDEFCIDGGFTGGTCVDQFPKFKRLEGYFFQGTPRAVYDQLECERKL
jgi:hypothetical protein